MSPCATPASAGLLDRSDVRKSTPRSAKTLALCASWVPTRTIRTARDRSRASNRAPAKTRPEMSMPWRRTDRFAVTGIEAAVMIRLLVLLPRSAHEHVADDVQGEGPEEEQALEGGGVPGHLVAPVRQRSHRTCQGLAWSERVDGEQGARRGAGREG